MLSTRGNDLPAVAPFPRAPFTLCRPPRRPSFCTLFQATPCCAPWRRFPCFTVSLFPSASFPVSLFPPPGAFTPAPFQVSRRAAHRGALPSVLPRCPSLYIAVVPFLLYCRGALRSVLPCHPLRASFLLSRRVFRCGVLPPPSPCFPLSLLYSNPLYPKSRTLLDKRRRS